MKRLLAPILSFLFLFSSSAFAVHKIIKVSGDNQTGYAGYPLREDFIVRVTSADSAPVQGAPVAFTVIYQPEQDGNGKNRADSIIAGGLNITDDAGFARARLNVGYPGTGDILVSAVTRETIGDPVVFKAVSRSRGWLVTILFGIIGGLGIFLFGMFYLNDALQKIAGQKLKEFLVTLTKSPLRGVGTGLFVTLLNQSSSATTVLEVSLVSAGLLTFYQTIAVTMGTGIGSTVTSQLLAFKLADFSVLIAGVGFYVMVLSHSKKWKNIGEAVLGFGILFLGMKIMTDLLVPLKDYVPFLDTMKNVGHPLLGILVGLVFTAILQSSGATAGIVIALALAGVINLNQAVLINLGAQVGTCTTALIASIGRGREGRIVAVWHLVHKSAGVLILLPFLTLFTVGGKPLWIGFVEWFTRLFFFTEDLARQIAMAHTLAAVVNTAAFFFLIPAVYKVMTAVMPAKEKERPFGPQFIDDNLIATPALALEQARREVVREGEIVADMLKCSMEMFQYDSMKMCDAVSLKDIRVDILRNAIVAYLSKIAQGSMSEEQSGMETRLLLIASDIEEIGDIIDKNIVPLARKTIDHKMKFSANGWKDIIEIHERVSANLENAVAALRGNDLEFARIVADSKQLVNELESDMRKRHVGRLNSGLRESLETSSVHLDLIDCYKRINSHTASVGMTLLGKA
ncbi:MAG: Na/Pi cotransporter family protein [Elusimicrobiota bacterium]